MKIIVGLGNPGSTYASTRHNIGFFLIDALREKWGFEPWKDSRHKSVVSEGVIGDEKIILVKPTTFMNLSGESVGSLVQFYKIDPLRDLLVISDDVDMVFGKVRFRPKGSSGGQNGLKSIITHLGTEEFPRIKIGIGRDEDYTTSDWVLSKFTSEEQKILKEKIFEEVEKMALTHI